jgi:uncharacterized protein
MRRRLVLLLAVVIMPAASAGAQDRVDPALLADIGRIAAIDTHCHAGGASPVGAEPSDPLGSTPFPYPVRLRPDNPEYETAWRALWGEVAASTADERARATLRAKWRIRREQANGYPAWVLDRAHLEMAFVNADLLGPGQAPPRFRWIAGADDLLVPLGNSQARFTALLADAALEAPPLTLAQYQAAVVTPTLQRWQSAGAVAIKFTMAYARPLDIAVVSTADAERIYTRGRSGGTLTSEDRKALQDYLFQVLCVEAGRLNLVVQIHTGIGADPYFAVSGSRPALLEPILNAAAMRHTRIVLVHGGWPYDAETGAMLIKPNVYADFSAQTFLRSTHALAQTLRAWLEWYPEKVLFGSDAYDDGPAGTGTPLAGWEEKIWLGARTAREALAIALTGMIDDGQITRSRALDLARLVLRGNAERVYGIGPG